ncbi:hypothetical protein [Methylophilus sp. TWE2]|uniref:hypothetical protein n=1 Tax=Methylophilus sp. TWE2 TaxID=1662285 RepID=UPI000676C17C|nr:hypothetical protein [Methylophilus sp. TWE2]AKR43755.1 hypothetical protein ACJ67_10175 [Methylophilus sp. TWE2]
MSRHSKLKRDTRKKKKKGVAKDIRETAPINLAPTPPVIQLLSNPFEGLTDKDRKQALIKISSDSKAKVEDSLKSIIEIFKKHDPIAIVTFFSTYGLAIGAGDRGVDSNGAPIKINQAHVEILQALALSIPPNEMGKLPALPHITQQIMDNITDLLRSYAFSRISPELLEASVIDKAIHHVQEAVRGYTQTVRNWGYHKQVLTFSKEIYSHFDAQVEAKFGFTVSNVIDVFEQHLETIEEQLTKRLNNLREIQALKKPRSMLNKYHEINSALDRKDIIEGQDLEFFKLPPRNAFMWIMTHYDLFLSEMYKINEPDLIEKLKIESSSLTKLLNYFSFELGELEKENKLYFFLDNPVWRKPVISTSSGYYCVMPQLFFSFVLNILDNLIETINKDKLHDRRANYLEGKIEEIVKRRFPESKVVSSLKWNQDGVQYETDLVAFIDSYAIIIEAKAHKISNVALRGAPDRIKRHLNDILIEPGIQSHRFELKLKELRAAQNQNDPLIAKLPVDITTINKVIRVSVSLEYFASLQSNLKVFENTGWIPDEYIPCPSMSIADFETLFDFLEHPVQIIHYLLRRAEIESSYSIRGDELDYMGFYISTLFDMGNVDKESDLHITNMSSDLDRYYSSRDQGIHITKPQPKISEFFKTIFNKLEERGIPRWAEIGCILNYFPPYDQTKIVKAIRELTFVVNRNWHVEGHKNMLIYEPSQSSEYALAIVLFNNENKARRHEFLDIAAANGLKADHVRTCLVIGINIDKKDSPYHTIGLFDKPG